MELARRVAFVILILVCTVRRLEAQRSAPIAVGASLERGTRPPVTSSMFPGAFRRDTSSTRTSVIARDALIGAGVGAVAGLITAVIGTQTKSYSDHSEDSLAYLYLPIYGAMVGVVAGVIVGLIQIH